MTNRPRSRRNTERDVPRPAAIAESMASLEKDVRARILSHAIEIFAQKGYAAASARLLTKAAGVNLAALTYYFGGKAGLYQASLLHVVACIENAMRPALDELSAALARPSEELTQDRMLSLILSFMDRWLALHNGQTHIDWRPSYSLLFVRVEWDDPGIHASTLKMPWARIFTPFFEIVARSQGASPDSVDGVLLALSLLGQATMFRVQPDGSFPALDRSALDGAVRDAMRDRIHRNVAAILGHGPGSALPRPEGAVGSASSGRAAPSRRSRRGS
jgi:AcrR family transcriptional regulator